MENLPIITLRHLLIQGEKCIGMQFYPDKVIHALIKTLDRPKWSPENRMVFVPNTPDSFNLLFKTFKGVAYLNCRYFLRNRPLTKNAQAVDLATLKSSQVKEFCPPEYIERLEVRRYSLNTARNYISVFIAFRKAFMGKKLIDINEIEIKRYIHDIVKQGKSQSYQNQVINAIKFYYEQVLDMPQRFYEIDRPRAERKLASVLSEEEIGKTIAAATNLKHKTIILTIYSCGLRLSVA